MGSEKGLTREREEGESEKEGEMEEGEGGGRARDCREFWIRKDRQGEAGWCNERQRYQREK
jgi:hypothetical protein